MLKTRVLLAALSALLAVAILTGCSASVSVGDDGWDAGKAESEISKGIEAQNKGVEVKSVDCPDDVNTDKGTTATCKVTLQNGQTGDAKITMTGDGGFDYKVN